MAGLYTSQLGRRVKKGERGIRILAPMIGPRKGQEMSPDVFIEEQVFTIEVKDNNRNSADKQKAGGKVCSVVTAIVSVERPSLHSPQS